MAIRSTSSPNGIRTTNAMGAAYGPRWWLSADTLHRLMDLFSTRVIPAFEVACILGLIAAAAAHLLRASLDVLPRDVLAGVRLARQAKDPVAEDVPHHL